MSGQDPLLPIRPHLAEWFGTSWAEDIGQDDNLVDHGLDSIRLMRVTGALRSGGARVTVAELSKVPTLRAWAALAADGGPPASPAADGAPFDETAPFDLAPMQHAYWVGRGDGHALGGVAAPPPTTRGRPGCRPTSRSSPCSTPDGPTASTSRP